MDEAKRYFRYALPGMVYLILLLVTFVILQPSEAKALLLPGSKDVITATGEIIGAFLLSGGLGYIISIIYFGAYYIIADATFRHIYNHENLLRDLISDNRLVVRRLTENGLKEDRPKDRRESWYLANVYLHGQTKDIELQGVNERVTKYYSDLATSLATTFTSAICSLVTFLVLLVTHYSSDSKIGLVSVVAALLIYELFILFAFLNHRRTWQAYEKLINIAIATSVVKENKPVEMVLPR